MTTMKDRGDYSPYGFGPHTIEFAHINLLISGLAPLLGADAAARVLRAAYCGGLEAALVSIHRLTGMTDYEPNNFNSLAFHLRRLDHLGALSLDAAHTAAADAPLSDEAQGLLELADFIADGLETGDIVLIDEHGASMTFVEETLPGDDTGAVMFLSFEEANFMHQCCQYEGLIVYPHQANEMQMAGKLEAGGLVTVDRVGPFVVVSAARPGEEE